MAKYCLVVVSDPVPGKEEEYNRWYNEQHLPDVLKVPGFGAAQRFKAMGDGGLPGKYIALYEMDCDSPKAAEAALAELYKIADTPQLFISDAIDRVRLSVTLCAAASPRLSAAR